MQVYSTLQALLGFRSSESDVDPITISYPTVCSFAVTLPSRFPSASGTAFPLATSHGGITPSRDLSGYGPLFPLTGIGSRLGIGPALKLLSRLNASYIGTRFHPVTTTKTLLTFHSFRVFTGCPGLPPPFEVHASIGFFCNRLS